MLQAPETLTRIDFLELTPYQEIFYNEWLLNPQRTDYIMIMDQLVAGPLDLTRAGNSVRILVNSYRLMSSNVKKTGTKVGWVRRGPIAPDDYMRLHEELEEDQILELVQRPFDLENDVLTRMHIIKLKNGHFRVITMLHHILIDGLSCKAVYDQMELFYNDVQHTHPQSLEEQEHLHQKLAADLNKILTENRSRYCH